MNPQKQVGSSQPKRLLTTVSVVVGTEHGRVLRGAVVPARKAGQNIVDAVKSVVVGGREQRVDEGDRIFGRADQPLVVPGFIRFVLIFQIAQPALPVAEGFGGSEVVGEKLLVGGGVGKAVAHGEVGQPAAMAEKNLRIFLIRSIGGEQAGQAIGVGGIEATAPGG